ncbi:polysaccharide biosynthesis PFTS motif protein [Pseudomonadota bacterium]
MRGYRHLKASGDLARLTGVKEELTRTDLKSINTRVSKLMFGAGRCDSEIATRQYMLIRVCGLGLNKALLASLSAPGASVVYPLPSEWIDIVKKHGFTVSRTQCLIRWYGYVFLILGYGALKSLERIFSSAKEIVSPSLPKLGKFVYFEMLSKANLPQPAKDGRSFDVISWYLGNANSFNDLDSICHSVKGADSSAVEGVQVLSVPSGVLPLSSSSGLLRYVGWCFAAIFLAVFDLLRGRWWHAFMFNEASQAAIQRMQSPNLLAAEYMFHNSNWIYRPLWTYEVVQRGAEITFYFYSTNIEPFKSPDGYRNYPYGLKAISWPRCLVWDEYQARYIHGATDGRVETQVVGPVWFHTSSEEMPPTNVDGIALFDVTPYRASLYVTLGVDPEYYLPETSNKFAEDSYRLAVKNGCSIFWKRKRDVGKLAHPKYTAVVDKLSERDGVVVVDTNVSAFRVIEASELVISLPFTSTAQIAQELGKPTCYYDPTGMVQKDDLAAHGIPIISGPNELDEWIRDQRRVEL